MIYLPKEVIAGIESVMQEVSKPSCFDIANEYSALISAIAACFMVVIAVVSWLNSNKQYNLMKDSQDRQTKLDLLERRTNFYNRFKNIIGLRDIEYNLYCTLNKDNKDSQVFKDIILILKSLLGIIYMDVHSVDSDRMLSENDLKKGDLIFSSSIRNKISPLVDSYCDVIRALCKLAFQEEFKNEKGIDALNTIALESLAKFIKIFNKKEFIILLKEIRDEMEIID